MNIPDHILRGKRSKADKSSAILKFVILNLAAQHTDRASVRSLAKRVGLEHSTISIYIRRGQFSPAAAERIVRELAVTDVKPDHLINPLALLSASPG